MYKKKPKAKFLHSQITAFIEKNPRASSKYIADKFGASYQYVYQLRKRLNLDKALTMSKPSAMFLLDSSQKKEVVDKVAHMEKVLKNQMPLTEIRDGQLRLVKALTDNVNSPSHYKVGGIETIDFIEAKSLSYNLGNVIKYLTRADHKGNKLEDLKKAQWYLNREISKQGK